MEELVFLYCTMDNMTDIEGNYIVCTTYQVLPNIIKLTSPVLEVVYNIQYSLGDINLK